MMVKQRQRLIKRRPKSDKTAVKLAVKLRSNSSQTGGQTAVKRRPSGERAVSKCRNGGQTGGQRAAKTSGGPAEVVGGQRAVKRVVKEWSNGERAVKPAEVVGGEAEPVRLPEDGQVPPRQPAGRRMGSGRNVVKNSRKWPEWSKI